MAEAERGAGRVHAHGLRSLLLNEDHLRSAGREAPARHDRAVDAEHLIYTGSARARAFPSLRSTRLTQTR